MLQSIMLDHYYNPGRGYACDLAPRYLWPLGKNSESTEIPVKLNKLPEYGEA